MITFLPAHSRHSTYLMIILPAHSRALTNVCPASSVAYCFTNSRPESQNSLSGYPIHFPLLPSLTRLLFSRHRTLKAKAFSVRNVSPFLSTVLAEAYHWILFHNTLFAQTLKTGSRELPPPPASGMSQRSGCSVRGCWEATGTAASQPPSITVSRQEGSF